MTWKCAPTLLALVAAAGCPAATSSSGPATASPSETAAEPEAPVPSPDEPEPVVELVPFSTLGVVPGTHRPHLLPLGVADAAGRRGFLSAPHPAVEAVDLATGELLWHRPDAFLPLLALEDVVFAAAVDSADGVPTLRLETWDAGTADPYPPVTLRSHPLLGTAGFGPSVLASGEVLLEIPTGDPPGAATSRAWLIWSGETGEELANVPVPEFGTTPVAVAGTSLVCVGGQLPRDPAVEAWPEGPPDRPARLSTRFLVGLELETGAFRWLRPVAAFRERPMPPMAPGPR